MDMISIVPGMVFALGPLLFLVATCVIAMPELRSRKTETKQVRRRFLCTISGGFVGALVGVALKYSI